MLSSWKWTASWISPRSLAFLATACIFKSRGRVFVTWCLGLRTWRHTREAVDVSNRLVTSLRKSSSMLANKKYNTTGNALGKHVTVGQCWQRWALIGGISKSRRHSSMRLSLSRSLSLSLHLACTCYRWLASITWLFQENLPRIWTSSEHARSVIWIIISSFFAEFSLASLVNFPCVVHLCTIFSWRKETFGGPVFCSASSYVCLFSPYSDPNESS
jgi:hypothetical protein